MSSPTGTDKPATESIGAGSKARRARANTEPKSTTDTSAVAEPATEETIATEVVDKDVAEDTTKHEGEEAVKSPPTEGNVMNEDKEDAASESGQEQEPKGNVKEEAPTEKTLEVTDASDKHILYPG